MTTDNKPEQQQIDFWLEDAERDVQRILKYRDNGFEFYKKENLPIQTGYRALANYYADLGYAQFLSGAPRDVFRASFTTAAEYIIKVFKMTYDKNDPDYVGDKPPTDHAGFGWGCLDWWAVNEQKFITGEQYALIGANFDKAKELAEWYRNVPEEYQSDEIVHQRFAHALKFAVMGVKDPGKSLLWKSLTEMHGKKTKDPFKLNYLNQTQTLYGILDNDEERFNQGLELQVAMHLIWVKQEDAVDTPYEYICDDAVALANLGIGFGMKLTFEHYTLPEGLVMLPVA